MTLPEIFVTNPAVFVVKDTYQIMVPVTCPALMWVKVGDEEYYDDSNGILKSSVSTHRMTVPMEALDKEKSYTIVYRKIIDRKPKFAETEDEVRTTFEFKPVSNENIRIYHIADTHNKVTSPVAAGKYFGDKIDLLILNGDIPNHSGDIKYFTAIYEIAGQITGGKIPVVFSRGNHDTRGFCAENIAEYTPTENGNSYYTFRLGSLWGIVLDCGEDKADDHAEYGHTVCCQAFRKRETKYIKNIVKNAKSECEAEGVIHKIVVVHVPFTEVMYPPFDIEEEIYAEWAKILRESIKPEVMICGHKHDVRVDFPGSKRDVRGQACPIIIGSNPFLKNKDEDYFIGAAITLEEENINVKFTDSKGVVTDEIDFLPANRNLSK